MHGANSLTGSPIGRRLLLPPGPLHADLHLAARGIDRVHTDGDLPTLPVLLSLGLDTRGRFVVRDDEPSAILIRAEGGLRGFALLHEVGHFLDFAAFGEGTFASSAGTPLLEPWREACETSRAFQHLSRAIGELAAELRGTEDDEAVRLQALSGPEELWARSYAQFVAIRSGDAALRAQLDANRAPIPGRVYYPFQWDDEDFRRIEESIEALFRRLGWSIARTPRS
jgi:hypothetical protein